MSEPMDGFEPEILRIFEDADDAMQGVLGFQLYIYASAHSKFQDKVSKIIINKHIAPYRPPIHTFPLTKVWHRKFIPEELVSEMAKGFEWYFTFSSLTNLIGIFEAALKDFTDYLVKKGEIKKITGYKNLLRWTFNFVELKKDKLFRGAQDNDSKKIRANVPDVCCEVDEAWRARNCFVHNRGLFDEDYGKKPIPVPSRDPKMRPEFKEFQEHPEREIRVPMTFDKYVEYGCSHIELLHNLHDLIQGECFGLKTSGYSYKMREKRIDWRRVFNP